MTGIGFQYAGIKANRYLFNGKELIKDFNLSIYSYEFRSYDPAIGRWWQIDPIIKENMSGYSWVTNNPIRYFDILGLDSAQRNAAVQMALKFVSENSDRSSASYGENNNPQPGEPCDCSGLVKSAVMAGGEPNPNIGSNDYGTQNIVENTTTVPDLISLQEGNLIFFNTVEGRENSHVGIVSSINRDEKGNPASVVFIHSGSSTGPDAAIANLDGSGYWGSKLGSTPFRKWDTIPDKKVTYSGGTLPTHVVNGSGNSFQRPRIF